MRAYIQYLDAYGEWKATERMDRSLADVECAAMLAHGMDAFVRACN